MIFYEIQIGPLFAEIWRCPVLELWEKRTSFCRKTYIYTVYTRCIQHNLGDIKTPAFDKSSCEPLIVHWHIWCSRSGTLGGNGLIGTLAIEFILCTQNRQLKYLSIWMQILLGSHCSSCAAFISVPSFNVWPSLSGKVVTDMSKLHSSGRGSFLNDLITHHGKGERRETYCVISNVSPDFV